MLFALFSLHAALSGVNAQWFNEERERLLQQVVELTSTNADLSASNKSLHARVGVVEQEATSLRQSLQEEAQRHLSELKTKGEAKRVKGGGREKEVEDDRTNMENRGKTTFLLSSAPPPHPLPLTLLLFMC